MLTNNLKKKILKKQEIFEKNSFTNLRNLELLDLSHNLLPHLEGVDLSSLVSLRFLNLRNNNLTSLGIRAIPSPISLELISLDNNDWLCDERTSCFTREPLLEIIQNSSALLTAPLIRVLNVLTSYDS